MPAPGQTSCDEDPRVRRLEIVISTRLRAGVLTSLAIVLLGLGLMFGHHPDYLSEPPALERLTRPGAAFPHTVEEVAAGVRNFRGQAIVTLGLLLLIATPVFRVAVSAVAFVYQRDKTFVVLTLLVLFLLLVSFLLGQAQG